MTGEISVRCKPGPIGVYFVRSDIFCQFSDPFKKWIYIMAVVQCWLQLTPYAVDCADYYDFFFSVVFLSLFIKTRSTLPSGSSLPIGTTKLQPAPSEMACPLIVHLVSPPFFLCTVHSRTCAVESLVLAFSEFSHPKNSYTVSDFSVTQQ